MVVGGGLLGLEAAPGMQRSNTQVTVIEHGDRLLGQQLDEEASQRLQNSDGWRGDPHTDRGLIT